MELFSSYNFFSSQAPEKHSRRGRSRTARPALPILPPYPGKLEENVNTSSKNAKNQPQLWRKYINSANNEHVEEESRNDADSIERLHDDDEVIRSTITSWQEEKSMMTTQSSFVSDSQSLDIETIPFDEQPYHDRRRPVRRYVSESINTDRVTRDRYHLNRLQTKVNQRKVHPVANSEKVTKLNLKHLRASRMKLTRDLYKELQANEIIREANSDISSLRDLTTLSSYRGKCFDKMLYLLNDVAPLEEEDVPCSVNEEGAILSSNGGGKASVAELKVIKKIVQPKIQGIHESDIGDESVAFPEEIDQPDTDTIASKLSDVTSPTLQDGFELDEVPHFPFHATLKKNSVSNTLSSNHQNEHLPSLAEVNESSEDIHASAGASKSAGGLNIREVKQILGSTSASIAKSDEVDENKVGDMKIHQSEIVEEVLSILSERETTANQEQRNTEEDPSTNPGKLPIKTNSVGKTVRFFEPSPSNTESIPQTYCCIIM